MILRGTPASGAISRFTSPVDESARSLDDLKAVVQQRAANYINVKITKSGLLDGVAMAAFAKASGLNVMIGGMVKPGWPWGVPTASSWDWGTLTCLISIPRCYSERIPSRAATRTTARCFNHGTVQVSTLISRVSNPRCHSLINAGSPMIGQWLHDFPGRRRGGVFSLVCLVLIIFSESRTLSKGRGTCRSSKSTDRFRSRRHVGNSRRG